MRSVCAGSARGQVAVGWSSWGTLVPDLALEDRILIAVINTCWKFFIWGASLLAVVAVAVGAYFLVHLNDEIRLEVERLLVEQYGHLDVRVGDARLIEGRGIEVRNLSLRERDVSAKLPPLVEIDEVFLTCPVQIKQLIHGLPPVTQVVLRRPVLRASRGEDGSWNVEGLVPLPKTGTKPVEIVVQKGTLELAPNPARPDFKVAVREITGAFRRTAAGASRQGSTPGELVFAITATAAPLCKHISLAGRIDPDRRLVRIKGGLRELSFSAEDLAGLPDPLAEVAKDLRQLRGSVRFASIEVVQPAGSPPQITAEVECEQLGIRHDRIPDSIEGLSGKLVYQDGVLHASRLVGKCGSAAFELSLRRHGWGANAPFAVSGAVTGLNLRQRHWEALPGPIREVWEKYHAQGLVDIPRGELTYDGRLLRPHLEVLCRDISLESDKFPYPLRHVRGTGTITSAAGSEGQFANIALRLAGEATAERPVTIEGDFAVDTALAGRRSEPVGSIRVEGKGIVVDEPLLAALADGPQRFVRDLRPQGQFDVVWQSWRSDPAQSEPEKQLEITLGSGSVQYVKFPYPLQIVGGVVKARDGKWDFVDLSARNGGGTVLCSGSLRPSESLADPSRGAGPVLSLRFDATRLELDSTLRQALSVLTPDAEIAWDALNPAGQIDSMVTYHHVLGGGPPEIVHTVAAVDQSVSIKPTFFPYRIDSIEGKVHFGRTTATFENVRGKHGSTTVLTNGSFQKLGPGAWSLALNELSVDRLILEKELLSALPGGLARVVTRLNPRGQISLGNSSVGVVRAAPGEPIATNWRLNFDLHHASLDCGVQLDNISGGINLAGHGRGEEFTTDGELSLDSVRWNRFFASRVAGPLYADTTQVLLGRHACLARSIPPRWITADAYGGKLTGDAVATLGPPSRFALSAEYQAGDLRRLITENWPTGEDVQGEIYGRVALQGMSQSPETILGEGAVRIRNAELYELPQLIRLFQILQLREPDRTAFTRADAQFDVSGRHVYFRNLQLSGDAIALHGNGTVDFDQRLNLAFFSDLAPNDVPLAGLRSIMRQASNQVVRMHVQGTIADPRFNPEPLPWLNDGLQQIQQELSPQARRPGAERGAQSWFGPPWR